MQYKTNIILNNSMNIGRMITFEYERDKPLSEKEQNTINMIIADEFGALEDVFALSDMQDFFYSDFQTKLSGKDSEDFLNNLETRLSQFDVYIDEPEIKILPNDIFENDYKLNKADSNTIIYTDRGLSGALGFYDEKTNSFINKKDYSKKCFDIDYQDWFDYENITLIGEELNMVKPLIEPEQIEALESTYFEKSGKKYSIGSYSKENLEKELESKNLMLMTFDMASVITDLIERHEKCQNIQENINKVKNKNASLTSKKKKRNKNGI